jgi:ketosteroid isomerase-like protein
MRVVWTISGPVNILPFCGQRVGKDAVMKLLVQESPAFLVDRRFVPNIMLVDGNNAAVLARLTATKREDGHAFSYRIAHFIKFREEKSSNTFRLLTASTWPSRCSVTISPMTSIR